jgi:soluble lytic murein transglycosylase
LTLPRADLLELRTRLAIFEQRWDEVEYWIKQQPYAQSDRWLYWLGRALELQRKPGAAQAFDQAKALRGFYGFLAAQHQASPYRLPQAQVTSPVLSLTAAQQRWPFMVRIPLWLEQQEIAMAQWDWSYNLAKLPPTEQVQLGELALRHGWSALAVQASISAKAWDHNALRFPLAYPAFFQAAATEVGLAPSIAYAISRQESAFYPLAQSGAGARGLMQLMPGTAADMAKAARLKTFSQGDLFDPATNISLGTRYLKQLLDQYQNNRILMAAAYNAGSSRVDEWLVRGKGLPMDAWIESIPFRETRHYVQNVLAFALIYEQQLGNPQPLMGEAEQDYPY